MFIFIKHQKGKFLYSSVARLIVFVLSFSLIFSPTAGYAQMVTGFTPVPTLPLPGTMVSLSPIYTPAVVKGITIHPENPLQFDFIIDNGDTDLEGEDLKTQAKKLIKYFLASLTVPEDEMWVNLSPYEKDRMIPDGFGQTEMGRDLLAQDYLLKQLTASLLYPEDELGQKFWDRVYEKAQALYGTTEIPVDTFNKVWIVPEKATVFEHENSAFVVESHLKVMLEEDYEAQKFDARFQVPDASGLSGIQHPASSIKNQNSVSTSIIREIIIPAIEQEVNQGETFANLRQIYNSMILATWYKINLEESLLGQVYVDKNKVKGIDVADKKINQKIYDQYLEAFKKGVYNYIKEDYDPATKEIIPRKYFSGGFSASAASPVSNKKRTGGLGINTIIRNSIISLSLLGPSTLPSSVLAAMEDPGAIKVTVILEEPSLFAEQLAKLQAQPLLALTGLPFQSGQQERQRDPDQPKPRVPEDVIPNEQFTRKKGRPSASSPVGAKTEMIKKFIENLEHDHWAATRESLSRVRMFIRTAPDKVMTLLEPENQYGGWHENVEFIGQDNQPYPVEFFTWRIVNRFGKKGARGGNRMITASDLMASRFSEEFEKFNQLSPTREQVKDFIAKWIQGEVKALALEMTLKFYGNRLEYGGAKSAVFIGKIEQNEEGRWEIKDYEKWETMNPQNIAVIVRRHARELAKSKKVGVNLDHPSADVRTNPQIMAYYADEYLRFLVENNLLQDAALLHYLQNTLNLTWKKYQENPTITPLLQAAVNYWKKGNPVPELGVFNSKPTGLGGIEGRTESTGRGVAFMMHHVFGKKLQNMPINIQGFGNVGRALVTRLVEEYKAGKIKSIGEIDIVLTNKNGWTASQIRELITGMSKNRLSLSGAWHENILSDKRGIQALEVIDSYTAQRELAGYLLHDPTVEIISLNAMDGAVTMENIHDIPSGSYFINGANGGVTAEANGQLHDIGITVLPAGMTNIAGARFSIFETEQANMGREITREEAEKETETMMRRSYVDTLKRMKEFNGIVSMETTFRTMAVERYFDSQPIVEKDQKIGLTGEESAVELANHKQRIFEERNELEGLLVLPSTVALIQEMYDGGFLLGVYSSGRSTLTNLKRVGLAARFNWIVDGNDVKELNLEIKPSPEGYIYIMDQLGVSSSKVVIIEDSLRGVRAAARANPGLLVGVAKDDNAEELEKKVKQFEKAGVDHVVMGGLQGVDLSLIKKWFSEKNGNIQLGAAIFDSDGVILDTEQRQFEVWAEILDEYFEAYNQRNGENMTPFTKKEYDHFMRNRPGSEAVERFLKSRGINVPITASSPIVSSPLEILDDYGQLDNLGRAEELNLDMLRERFGFVPKFDVMAKWFQVAHVSGLYHNFQHTLDAAIGAYVIAKARGLTDEEAKFLFYVGLLHDLDPSRMKDTPARVSATMALMKRDNDRLLSFDGVVGKSFMQDVLGWTEDGDTPWYLMAQAFIWRSEYPFRRFDDPLIQAKDYYRDWSLTGPVEEYEKILEKIKKKFGMKWVNFTLREAPYFSEYVDMSVSLMNGGFDNSSNRVKDLGLEFVNVSIIPGYELNNFVAGNFTYFTSHIGDFGHFEIDRGIARKFGNKIIEGLDFHQDFLSKIPRSMMIRFLANLYGQASMEVYWKEHGNNYYAEALIEGKNAYLAKVRELLAEGFNYTHGSSNIINFPSKIGPSASSPVDNEGFNLMRIPDMPELSMEEIKAIPMLADYFLTSYVHIKNTAPYGVTSLNVHIFKKINEIMSDERFKGRELRIQIKKLGLEALFLFQDLPPLKIHLIYQILVRHFEKEFSNVDQWIKDANPQPEPALISAHLEEENVEVLIREVGVRGEKSWSEKKTSSPVEPEKAPPGGIDFNPELLNLQIKRDGRGVPVPLPLQPIGRMNIEGFLPIIINITPIPSLPMYLGFADTEDDTRDVSSNPTLDPIERREYLLSREIEQVSYLN